MFCAVLQNIVTDVFSSKIINTSSVNGMTDEVKWLYPGADKAALVGFKNFLKAQLPLFNITEFNLNRTWTLKRQTNPKAQQLLVSMFYFGALCNCSLYVLGRGSAPSAP